MCSQCSVSWLFVNGSLSWCYPSHMVLDITKSREPKPQVANNSLSNINSQWITFTAEMFEMLGILRIVAFFTNSQWLTKYSWLINNNLLSNRKPNTLSFCEKMLVLLFNHFWGGNMQSDWFFFPAVLDLLLFLLSSTLDGNLISENVCKISFT